MLLGGIQTVLITLQSNLKSMVDIKTLVAKFKDRFSKERFCVGLDIGTSTIKIVKLKFSKDTVELCSFGLEPSQPDPEEALRRVKQSLPATDIANIGVCGSSTVIRYVNFPQMNKDELRQALKFEAQKHIPFSLEEVNFDGYILKEALPDNKMLVLLAAVKKDLISQRLKLIEDAGFKADIIDIDSIALCNAFAFNYQADENPKHKAIALLNIGSSMSNLNILEDGIPCLSRDIHLGGDNFTQKLMEVFGTDFNCAEKLKFNPDKEKAAKITIAFEALLTNLAAEVRTSFDYYESQSTSSVVKIFLSGGGSKFAGLKDMLANFLGIEVEYWDPLKKISISGNLDSQRLKEVSEQMAVAIGLALRQ